MIPYPSSHSFGDPDRGAAFKSHTPGGETSTEINKNLSNVSFVEFNAYCLSLCCVPGNVLDVSANKPMKSPSLWNVLSRGERQTINK